MSSCTADHQRPRILVTRPTHQQSNFVEACKDRGWQPVCLATIVVEAITRGLTAEEADTWHSITQRELDSSPDWVLFTSRNAVEQMQSVAPPPWQEGSNRPKILAIGPATLNALQQHGQHADSLPVAPYTSEAFCHWALQQRPRPHKILVIKGVGGRTEIVEQLTKHGIHVSAIDVYRRARPTWSEEQLENVFNPMPDIVAATSNEGLNNLLALTGELWVTKLQRCQLVVNSQRMAAHARNSGFQGNIDVADPPGDEGQIAAIERLLAR